MYLSVIVLNYHIHFVMDKSQNQSSSSERFTAEEVRKILGLNDDYSNSSSSSSSDMVSEDNQFSDTLTDNSWSGSENEEIIPPSPKRIKRISTISKTNDQGQIVPVLHWDETCHKNKVYKPVEHDNLPWPTSGINHSSPTPHNIPQPTFIQQSEKDIPTEHNHAQGNIFQSVPINYSVPEPVFTIDFDTEAPHQPDSNMAISKLLKYMKMITKL